MNLIDTNYILRYLLKDIEDQYLLAQSVIERESIFIPDFIVAEIIYVLERVYLIDRKNIENALSGLFSYPNLIFHERAVILQSLSIYSSKGVDYSDALLIAYYKADEKNKVFTFDKKLTKLISEV
jgi:predicted nucleic-acid-binding protein